MCFYTLLTSNGYDELKTDAPRKHLAEDLCPYTCPFSDCPAASILYITREAWKDHINKRHSSSQYWECLACMGVENPDTFSSIEAFTLHTKTRHRDTIAESRIPTLQELCCKTVPPTILACPLCFSAQQGPDFVDSATLLEHIGDCIHEFSLKALPWAESIDGEEFARIPSIDTRVSKWFDTIEWPTVEEESLVFKFLDVESQAPASDKVFVASEYFVENSENSSRVEREPPPSLPDLSQASSIKESEAPLTAEVVGSVLSSQGKYDEAEAMHRRELEGSKKVFGPEHPDTLTSMANLASTYSNQGRWKEAEELGVQVIETRKRVLRAEHLDTLTSMNNLALIYSSQGRWKEAEELEVQVMETRKRVLGEEHPSTLSSMANLASTYSNQGRWKEAEIGRASCRERV